MRIPVNHVEGVLSMIELTLMWHGSGVGWRNQTHLGIHYAVQDERTRPDIREEGGGKPHRRRLVSYDTGRGERGSDNQ